MSVSSVTLDEILAAAHTRSASLVPETSGYLALAIADASARLPFRLEDTMVHLSTEGTVKVARGTEVLDAAECATITRDILARLLARSIGGMPGLSQAAKPRQESAEGVDTVIGDIEGALVPVNRAAARRALARLAREVVKAREAGKLRRRARPQNKAVAEAAEMPLRQREASPKPVRSRELDAVAAPIIAPQPAPKVIAPSPRRAEQPLDALSVDVSFSELPPDVAEAPRAPAEVDFAISLAEEREPTPTEMGTALEADEPMEPTSIDSVAVVLEQSRIASRSAAAMTVSGKLAVDQAESEREAARREKRAQRRREIPGEALFQAAEKKTVDDLVASFSVSGYDSDGSLKATRASLKRLAGLDATPPPPAIAMRGLTPAPPGIFEGEITPLPTPAMMQKRPSLSGAHVAWVVVGLVVAGLLGHYVPTWLDRSGSNGDHQPKPSTELSQTN